MALAFILFEGSWEGRPKHLSVGLDLGVTARKQGVGMQGLRRGEPGRMDLGAFLGHGKAETWGPGETPILQAGWRGAVLQPWGETLPRSPIQAAGGAPTCQADIEGDGVMAGLTHVLAGVLGPRAGQGQGANGPLSTQQQGGGRVHLQPVLEPAYPGARGRHLAAQFHTLLCVELQVQGAGGRAHDLLWGGWGCTGREVVGTVGPSHWASPCIWGDAQPSRVKASNAHPAREC